MKFLITVCTCKKNIEKAIYFQNILTSKTNYEVFFYHGEGDSPNKNFIYLNTSDCYSELTKKTYKMLNYFKEKQFDYLVKIDDDTFLDFESLEKTNFFDYEYIGGASSLKNHLDNFKFYKAYLLKNSLNKNINFEYTKLIDSDFKYIMGNFCIIKKTIIDKILNFINKDEICMKIPQEDISLGYVCNKLDIPLLDLSENIPYYHITKENLSYHPIPIILQNMLYRSSKKIDRLYICNKFLPINKYFKK